MLSKSHLELSRRLNYSFVDSKLLGRALTHRSHGSANYERLEFLGDSVLNFTISAELYIRFPELTEGELTRLRASLVKKSTLAKMARNLKLGDYLSLGTGEIKSGGYDRDSILADSLEAVFGAVYTDSGVESVRKLILELYLPTLTQLNAHKVPKDPKTRLQEYLQKLALPVPTYTVIEISGDPHNQEFIVECNVSGLETSARGSGNTRRNAEQQAASEALEQLCPE